MRRCTSCGTPKPLDQFRRARAHFLRGQCRACENATDRREREAHGYGRQRNQHSARHDGCRPVVDCSALAVVFGLTPR